MKILITGGAGYLGSIFTEHLLSQGGITKLVVYDNMMYNQTSLISHTWRSNFEYVYGDVRNKKLLRTYIEEFLLVRWK